MKDEYTHKLEKLKKLEAQYELEAKEISERKTYANTFDEISDVIGKIAEVRIKIFFLEQQNNQVK